MQRIVFLSLLLLGSGVPAATISWTNLNGGNWSVPANWDPHIVPGAADTALITASGTYVVTLDAPASIASLSLGGSSGTQTLTNPANSLSIAVGAVVNANGVLGLGGGTLGGTNRVSGTMNWSAGTVTSPLTIASGGQLNIVGNSTVSLYAPLTNAGTINWSNTGSFSVYNNNSTTYSGAIYNLTGGFFNIETDQYLYGQIGQEFFNNAGHVRKSSGTGTSSFYMPLTNNGTVRVEQGTLTFLAGGIITGAYDAASGAGITFSGGNFVAGAGPVLSGLGAIQLTGGTLLLPNDVVPNLALTGGTVNLGPSFQGGAITNLTLLGSTLGGTNRVTGALYWMAGIVSGPLTIAGTGQLNIYGSTVSLYAPLTNAGTINWSNTSTFSIYNNNTTTYSGAIYNLLGGIFNIETDQYLYGQIGQEFVNNAGLVRKLSGTGTTSFYLPLANSGTVSVQQGTVTFLTGGTISGTNSAAAGAAINFAGGNFTAGTSPMLNGPGPIQFTGGTLLLPADVIPNLPLVGGTVNLGPGFQGGTITNLTLSGSTLGGTNRVSGTLNWMAGIISGPLTVSNGGLLNILGNSTVTLYAPLTNAGTINWSNTSTFSVYNNNGATYSGAIYNLVGGLFNIETDQYLYGQIGQEFFSNAGTVRKLSGTGTTSFYLPLTNSGTVSVQEGTLSFQAGGTISGAYSAVAGATINFAAGTFIGGASPVLSGPGAIQFTGGTLLLPTDVIPNLPLIGGTVNLGPGFQGGTITNLTLSGSTLGGTNRVTGALNWLAGTISGPLTVANGGLLNILGNSTVTLYAPLTNAGTINWSNTSTFSVYNNNSATYSGAIYNLAGGLFNIETDQYLYGQIGQEFFNNAGLVRKLSGTGTTSFYLPLTNSGTVSVQQGTVTFLTGGTISGTNSAAAGAAINFAGGNFTAGVNPVLTGPGAIQFTGGTLLLPSDVVPNLALIGGTVNVGPSFQGGGITNLTISGSTLGGTNRVNGTLNWIGGVINGPLTVASSGQLNILGNSTVSLYAPLTNAGTINWSNTSTFSIYNNHSSTYSGAIYNLDSGLFNIETDQYLYGQIGQEFFNNAGVVRKLSGTGTSSFYMPLTNSGIVSAQRGRLYFQLGFVQGSSATLASGLGGPNPGIGYGQMQFANPLALAGTFAVSTANGYQPTLTDTFTVLTFPSSSGTFAALTGLDLGVGLWLQPHFNPADLTLSVTNIPTTPPQLKISDAGANALIQAFGYTNWVLQSATNLDPVIWTSLPGSFTNQALVPITGREKWFRLKSN